MQLSVAATVWDASHPSLREREEALLPLDEVGALSYWVEEHSAYI